ncbi:carbohydrate ABC transporter permease [Streptomyces sp. NPDC055099]
MSTVATQTRTRPQPQPQSQPGSRFRIRGSAGLGLAAWLAGILFFLPIAWMTLTSFHSEEDAATNPPSVAASLTLDGYREFFGSGGGASPWPALINSTVASVASTLLVLVLALPAAYALSIRPVKKWTDVLFFFLSTKMLPVVAGLLPIYLFAKNAEMLDNIWLLVILYTSMNLPIAVWMMQSFLAEVPVAIIEAAQIDGARLPTILARVVAPIALPGIAATSLICFIFSWNELLFARVLTGVVAQTAPVFLTGFITSQGLFLAKVCAASLVISLPVLAAGFAAQDKLVQGLSLGAVK